MSANNSNFEAWRDYQVRSSLSRPKSGLLLAMSGVKIWLTKPRGGPTPLQQTVELESLSKAS